jgi:hypothetical protein
MNQFLLLLVGFLLTTVLGGLLGYFFQNRTWDHQNRVTAAAAHRDAAFAVFQELSSLMDKRLYRMRVFDDVLASSGTTDKDIQSAREDYRQVRYEWNDNLNRNLARVEAYFGLPVRLSIETGVYEQFSQLHRELTEHYDQRQKHNDVTSLRPQLDSASLVIYNANLAMLGTIRSTWQPSSGDGDAGDERAPALSYTQPDRPRRTPPSQRP